MASQPALVLLRLFDDLEAAEEARMALLAAGIPSRLEEFPGGAALHVPVEFAFDAKRQIDALVSESAADAAEPAESGPPSLLGWLVAAGLSGLYLAVGPRRSAVPWFERGASDAARVRAGAWWRAVTALTLHADLGHLLGNAAAAVILVGPLATSLGIGSATWLLLLSGTAGNLAAAAVHAPGFSSVGASTALFGALGALTALGVTRGVPFKRRFLAFGAGLALLGFLGTGRGADLAAHLFGFAAGTLLGFAAASLDLPRRRGPAPAQAALAVLALGAVVLAWRLAFA